HGMQEVSGSIPLSSTKIVNPRRMTGVFFICMLRLPPYFVIKKKVFPYLTSIDVNKPVYK
ncbi:hypothetical protein, partial [Enterobacter cloacae]|uniref:hypothetical protein n=1 Tax=Enterobacter cloacae TaxID=550 RepID=UPI000A9DAE8D